jgi:hypothetical protein
VLEDVEDVPITPQLLKAVTAGMRGDRNQAVFAAIFAKLAAPRFFRKFNLAFAGQIHLRL